MGDGGEGSGIRNFRSSRICLARLYSRNAAAAAVRGPQIPGGEVPCLVRC